MKMLLAAWFELWRSFWHYPIQPVSRDPAVRYGPNGEVYVRPSVHRPYV